MESPKGFAIPVRRILPRIGSLVTLTGSVLYAQATTCSAYLQETWPNSGQSFRFALQAALDSKGGHNKEGKLAHTKGNTYTLHFLHGILFSVTITQDIVLYDALLELEGATLVSSENIRRCGHIWLSVVRVRSLSRKD